MYLTSKCQAPSYQNWNHMEMHLWEIISQMSKNQFNTITQVVRLDLKIWFILFSNTPHQVKVFWA